jgi:hypothetical protein
MTAAEGALNGSGPQTVYINVYREGQSGFGWQYRIIVNYLGKNYGSWTTSTQYWSANAGGATFSGTFTIPSGTNDVALLNTTFWRGADGNGYGSDFYSSASIDTNHSSIGDGSVTVYEGAPPRIAVAPSTPGAPSFSLIAPYSVRVASGIPGDNGGAGIDTYEFQRALDAGFATGLASVTNGGYLMDMSGLSPATKYWYRTRAHSSAGWSGWSASNSVTTTADVPDVPGVPVLSGATPSSVTATWTAAAPRGAAVTAYEVQWSTSSTFASGNASATQDATLSRTLSGLRPATTYYVRVRATNATGTGAWSAAAPVTTKTAVFYIDPYTNIAEPVVLHYWNGTTYEPLEVYIDPDLTGAFVPAGT